MGKMVARRRATYGGKLGKPGEPGPLDVYDAQGNRLARFASLRKAKRYCDEEARLQHHDKDNKPIGPLTSPGVIVVKGQQLVHISRNANPRTKEFKGLLEHLAISPNSALAGGSDGSCPSRTTRRTAGTGARGRTAWM